MGKRGQLMTRSSEEPLWARQTIRLRIGPVENPGWIREINYLQATTLFHIEWDGKDIVIICSVDYALKMATYFYDNKMTVALEKIIDRITWVANQYVPFSEFRVKDIKLSSMEYPDLQDESLNRKENDNGLSSDGRGISQETRNSADTATGT